MAEFLEKPLFDAEGNYDSPSIKDIRRIKSRVAKYHVELVGGLSDFGVEALQRLNAAGNHSDLLHDLAKDGIQSPNPDLVKTVSAEAAYAGDQLQKTTNAIEALKVD